MKYFITGANGFVGKEFIKILKKKGIKYKGIDNSNKISKNITKIELRNKRLHKFIPEGSTVIHLAGVIKPYICKNYPIKAMDINLNGTINLIKSSEKKNVKKIIFASSEWVYGETQNNKMITEKNKIDVENIKSEYALSKIYGENFVKLSDKIKQKIVLRFGIIYGAREGKDLSALESLFHDVKSKKNISIGSKKTARKFVHVKDLAKAIYLASRYHQSEIFNITGDQLITLDQIINLSAKKIGKKILILEKNKKSPNIRNVSNLKAKKFLKWELKYNLIRAIDELKKSF